MLAVQNDTLTNEIEALRPRFESTLAEAIGIPTVSADPAHAPDIRRGAEWALRLLDSMGAEATIVETDHYPVLVANFKHPDAKRTLTIYNHLDVQPANEPEWTSEPFVCLPRDGIYPGRGATDDKGPALSALFAVELARKHNVPLNFRMIWEFEEEIGSPSFEAFLEAHAAELATDSVLVSDTIWIARGKPAAPLGLRGLLGLVLSLETGSKDAHSGLVGGAARNPIGELCQLLSELHDARTGEVKIPGFYDAARPVTEAERQNFLASGFDAKDFAKAHGLKSLRTNDPVAIAERIWAKPTFEVHGITGGYQGPGLKAIVPPRAEAKVSMRLVPDMTPEATRDLVTKFITERAPDVKIEVESLLQPYAGSADGPYADAVRSALRFGFGAEPAFVREGGSIGAVVSMQRVLKAPIMFIGLSLPEQGYHAPNEFFEWEQASGGMKSFMHYFAAVAAL